MITRTAKFLIEYQGEILTVCDFAKRLGYSPSTIFRRYHSGHKTAEAILQSLKENPPRNGIKRGTGDALPTAAQHREVQLWEHFNQWRLP